MEPKMPEQFLAKKTEQSPISPEEKEIRLNKYDEFASEKLNEAYEIYKELQEYKEKRREKDETFDFEKYGKLLFDLADCKRLTVAEAEDVNKYYHIQVEIPDFEKIIEEKYNNEKMEENSNEQKEAV